MIAHLRKNFFQSCDDFTSDLTKIYDWQLDSLLKFNSTQFLKDKKNGHSIGTLLMIIFVHLVNTAA